MRRVLSGIQPSGDVHLGNLLGALRNWVADQHTHESFHPIVDLHAITVPQDPAELQAATLRLAQLLMASGLDPEICVLWVQSHVPEHAELSWILECTAGFGELRRMHQFKDKAEGADFVAAGLFTYPVLQAADILLYDTDVVPVGDDQRQHLELTRDIAQRFNARHGDVLVVPEHRISPAGARVMDLQDPTRKMSKSLGEAPGTIWLLDDPDTVRRKIRRAVTDSEPEVRFDRDAKPGVSKPAGDLRCRHTAHPAGGGRRLRPLRAAEERLRRGGRRDAGAHPAALRRVERRSCRDAAGVAGWSRDRRPDRRGHDGTRPRGNGVPPPPLIARCGIPALAGLRLRLLRLPSAAGSRSPE